MENLTIDKKCLLDVKEVMLYIGWGERRVRELLNDPASTFTVRNGNKLYANRKKLEMYFDKMTLDH